jgi:hypothetical protein
MKKNIFQLVVVLGLLAGPFLLQIGCESKGTAVTSPVAPTSTPTNTFTQTRTFTNTPTIGSPTNTPTNTASPTATVPNIPVFMDSLTVGNGEGEFDGGGCSSCTGSDLADTSNPYEGTSDMMWWFASTGSGGYAGWNVTQAPATTLSGGFTTCSFWAKVNRVYTGSGIEFFGGQGGTCAAPANHLMALTTSYAHYSFALPSTLDGSCTVGTSFGVVINNADVSDLPGAGPITIYVDDVQYQ